MPRPAHRPSQRDAILDAALSLLRAGDAVSMDTAARAAGVTKPGLIYHFPTKEALLAALVDHLLDGLEEDLLARVPDGADREDPRVRISAYLRWSFGSEHDAAELVTFADPRLRETMAARWAERFRPWLELPGSLPPDERARLHLVRLLADGCWYADATGVLPLPTADRSDVLAAALSLLGEEA